MIGERVKLAREACALTQEELSERAGVPLGTLGQIEVGRIFEPAQGTIQAISAATGFPDAFFGRGPLPDLPDGNYRKFARGTSKAEKQVRALTRQMVEIVQGAEDVLKLPQLEIGAVSELASIDAIEGCARDVRHALRVGEFDPIPNLMRAVERAGVIVFRLPLSMEDHEGFSVWPYFGLENSRPVIVVTGDHSGDRDRFTVAHELGHLVLHSARRGINPGQAETEAHRFAGALLLPYELAFRALQPPLTLDELMSVKATHGVSMQALLMRAFDLKIIDDRSRTSLYKQLARRGWRKNEPVSVDREQPLLLPKILQTLGGEGTTEDRASRLGMSSFAFSALVALMSSTSPGHPQTDQNA